VHGRTHAGRCQQIQKLCNSYGSNVKQLSRSLLLISGLFLSTSSIVRADANNYRPQERTEECDICMERQDTVVSLPCHHTHKMCIPCITDWFLDRNNDTCPTCRASVGQQVRTWLKGRDNARPQASRPSQPAPRPAQPQQQSNKCASCNMTASDPLKLPCGHVMCLRHAWQKRLEAGDDVWPPLWCPLCSTAASWECMSELERRAARAGLPQSGKQASPQRPQQRPAPQPAPRPAQPAPRPAPPAQQVDNCPICLDPVGSNGGEFALSCRHKLCLNCAKANFLDHHNTSCPLCRAHVEHATKERLRARFHTNAKCASCNMTASDPFKLPCGHVMCLRHAWQKRLEAGDDVWPPLWCPLCSTAATFECMRELEQRAQRAGLPRSGRQNTAHRPQSRPASQPRYSNGNNSSGHYDRAAAERTARAAREAWRQSQRNADQREPGERIAPEARIAAIAGILAVGGVCIWAILHAVSKPRRCCSSL